MVLVVINQNLMKFLATSEAINKSASNKIIIILLCCSCVELRTDQKYHATGAARGMCIHCDKSQNANSLAFYQEHKIR